jgi:hypothetical protein
MRRDEIARRPGLRHGGAAGHANFDSSATEIGRIRPIGPIPSTIFDDFARLSTDQDPGFV